MEFLDYDIRGGSHRSAEAEWAPHKPSAPSFFEWQYFTAPLMGDNGHRYFLLYCVFNFSGKLYRTGLQKDVGKVPEGKVPMVSIAHICDYDGNVFKTSNGLNFVSKEKLFDEKTGTLKITDVLEDPAGYEAAFSFKGDNLSLTARTDIYDCEIHCTGANRVMWMQDTLGKEGLIREGGRFDRSFYYSLPELPFTGWISYQDNDGVSRRVNVTGTGWVDRQWGNFMTMAWE